MKVVSLFSGAGGLDFGFEAAGFETRLATDVDPIACEVMRANRNWAVLEGAIEDIPSSAFLEHAGVRRGELDVLIGGPPCQPFSKSGYWASGDAKRLADPRAKTLEEYMRVLGDLRPNAFLLENVPGIAFNRKSDGLAVIQHELDEINRRHGTGYRFELATLNAADFGAPQLRERVYLVGFKDGRRFEFPKPTHGALHAHRRHASCWDAFADIGSPMNKEELRIRGKWADLLPSVPEGSNYLWHTERGGGEPLFGWRRRYWNFLLKLAKARPSWTIQAQPGPATGPFHWENRRLSPAELCRLQTFPDGLRFNRSISNVQRLLGNAVASAVAEKIALQIKTSLLGGKESTGPATLAPALREDCPPETKPAPVPKQYLQLANSDTDHPGTGKGRAAAAWSAA